MTCVDRLAQHYASRKLKSSIKKAIGKATSDTKRQVVGASERVEGEVQNPICGFKNTLKVHLKNSGFFRTLITGEVKRMSTIVIIIILLLIFGGGGGYYAHGRYGGAGLGGVLGTVLVILLVLWLLGFRI
jgi:uncharacterized protein YjbJ (UPF0337 family)